MTTIHEKFDTNQFHACNIHRNMSVLHKKCTIYTNNNTKNTQIPLKENLQKSKKWKIKY